MKYLLTALLFIACSQPSGNTYPEFLQPCNQVNIVLYNGGDTLYFNTKDSTGVEILKNLMSASAATAVTDTCAAQGRLEYVQDSAQIFTARFAAAPGDSENNCNYITYTNDGNQYTHQLSERAQKLLHKVMQTAPAR